MSSRIYDTIIIGSGAAGLTAAIYASRSGLDFVVLESGGLSGGQMLTTPEIDNYPGFPKIDGMSLSSAMRSHAENLGAVFQSDKIIRIERKNELWYLSGENNNYLTRTVIIATGAKHRPLGVSGEKQFSGRGVSYCAVCDGMFFKGKTVAVVGGGNTAAEDALYLAELCQNVYLIHRRDRLRANAALSDKVLACDNIIPLWNSEVKSIDGDFKVNSVTLNDGRSFELDGVFIAVGIMPEGESFRNTVNTDENGFIIADEDCITSASGIFAAGDVRTKKLRQIITAAADGANAAASAERYISYSGE